MIINQLQKNLWLHILCFFIFFGVFLWAGIHQIYHQDEYRWVEMALRIHDNPIDQPPLVPFLYSIIIKLFGSSMMRLLPAFFGLTNLVLVYLIAHRLSGRKIIGVIATGLFAITSYSLIASLQIDIDGAILPFFVLASLYCYLRFRQGDKRWVWLLGVALIG